MPIVFYFGALVDDGRNVFSIFKLTALIFPTSSQRKSSFKKTFMGNLWYVDNNFTDIFIDRQSVQKINKLSASFHQDLHR
jgi:hypothetical protein